MLRNKQVMSGVFIGVMTLILSRCAGIEPALTGKPLYDRLGGNAAIDAVVDHFVANVLADGRINEFFVTADIPKLKGHLVDQWCMMTGGPCTYKGRDMKTTHAGMNITNADFDALIEDLVAALDKVKVPGQEKGELLGLLGPMREDIVK